MPYNLFNWTAIARRRCRELRLQPVGRRAPRVRPSASGPVEVQIIGQDSLNILHARDVSVSGLGVHVPHRFAGCDVESEVQLIVTLPGQRSFVAHGAIRHASPDAGYFGVKFTAIDAADRGRIKEYVGAMLKS